MAKQTIYVDQDDEITAVIGKIKQSTNKVIAVVLPAHTGVFTSTINLKLIKKAEDTYKKSIVLITSSPAIVAAAGAAGLHTAKNLTSKPVLHKATSPLLTVVASVDLEEPGDTPPDTDKVGVNDNDVIQLDNTVKEPKQKGDSFNKKLKVPNFNSFRLKVVLGSSLLVVVVVFWIFAAFVLPKATITLKTDVSSIDSVLQLQATTNVKDFDASKPILPATIQETKKSDTEKVAATGKKDIGTKATGDMTLVNCTDVSVLVPAGTSFTNSGYSFALDESITVPGSDFFSNGNCKKNGKAISTVTAQKAGGESNLTAGRDYVSSFATTITGVGGAMGGGTSKLVTVVSEEDITAAKAKLAGKSKTAAQSELITMLEQSGLFALTETLSEGTPKITTSAEVDAEVADVVVTQETTYTMLAVSKTDIQNLLEADIKSKISDNKLKILNNGLDKKQILITEKKSPSDQKLQITAIATVGPDIDTSGIANEVVGMSRGDIQALLLQRSGVKDVVVRYDPFWVTKTPKKASKINVVVEQVNAKQ
ncbi:hypothetical protein EB118_01445 [bacterium]|nr:hypothetical protein [bacterium]NBX98559.1 hypothetical protein [bacterium]NDC93808.1 hypothetical protein [bacterium]NDD83598.1 hypothetical protein [bacterium]NDG28754.1 hypothetical protein [bacterium]